jgi:hypothetical protein
VCLRFYTTELRCSTIMRSNRNENLCYFITLFGLITIYSGTSFYHSRFDRFPAYTIRHFWSRIKFHINNVIYSRIHRSPNYRFTAFIVCKSRSGHSISRMDRLKKKIEPKYLFALHSLANQIPRE